MSSTEESQPGRLNELFSSIPCVCRSVLAVCLSVYAYNTFSATQPYAICAGALAYHPLSNILMLILPSFTHLGLMHIVMNLLTFVSIGVTLEQRFGSTSFFGLTVVLTLLGNILYTLMFVFFYIISGDISYLSRCAAGFSGVIFSMIVIESRLAPTGSMRSIFGFCSVPSWAYPFVLMAFIQMMMPNVSLIGHLAGALVGLLYSSGFLNWITLSSSIIAHFEPEAITRLDSFIVCPENSPIASPNCTCQCGGGGALWAAIKTKISRQFTSLTEETTGHGYRLGGDEHIYDEMELEDPEIGQDVIVEECDDPDPIDTKHYPLIHSPPQ